MLTLFEFAAKHLRTKKITTSSSKYRQEKGCPVRGASGPHWPHKYMVVIEPSPLNKMVSSSFQGLYTPGIFPEGRSLCPAPHFTSVSDSGLGTPSDQSDLFDWGEELDHWSRDSGEGVRKGWWERQGGVGSAPGGEGYPCCDGGVK